MNTKEIISIFRDNNIKATPQRIAVYKYLCEHRTHPDVESIYNTVIEENPAFSKTTIYNALKTLDESGLIIRILIDSGRVHYDADTSFHGHFRCEKCHKIYDFTPAVDESKDLTDFVIKQRDVYYSGICRLCK